MENAYRRGAIDALSAAHELAPLDVAIVRALAEETEGEQRASMLRGSARQLRAAIARAPEDRALYRRLREVA